MRRPFILCLIIILLAACRADVQPAPTITAAPVDKPTFTVTPSPGNNATALANARATLIEERGFQATRDIEALTPSPTRMPSLTPTITGTPRPTLTPLPTSTYYPTPTLQPLPANSGALPNGALDRIGIGSMRDSALSPDGSRIAMATSTGIYLYHSDDLRLVWRRYLLDPPDSIEWSTDGTMLLTGHSYVNQAILWDAVTAERIHEYDDIWIGVDWSPDTQLFAAPTPPYIVGDDGEFIPQPNQIGLFDRDGQQVFTLTSAGQFFYQWFFSSIEWSPDGRYLAAVMFDDPLLYIWDITQAEPIQKIDISEWQNYLEDIRFSPDSRRIAAFRASSGNGSIPIFDIESGTVQVIIDQVPSNTYDVQWSPDNTQIVAVGHRQTSQWDAATGQMQAIFDYPALSASWAADSSRVALVNTDAIRVLDRTGDTISIHLLNSGPLSYDGETLVHWLPDNRHMIVTSLSEEQSHPVTQEVVLWDTDSGEVIAGLQPGLEIQRVVWSADSRYLVLETSSGYAFWNALTHEVTFETPLGLDSPVTYFSGIAAHNNVDGLPGWQGGDVSSPNSEWRVQIEMDGFCGDGPWSGGCFLDNGVVRTVEFDTNRIVMERTFLTEGITSVAWSPLGNMLGLGVGEGYASDLNDTILIIDPFTGENLFQFVGHSSSIGWLRFSSQEDRVASVSRDGTVIIWDLTR